LVVVLPEQNIIERYDLATLRRELVVAKPAEGTVRNISMGSASAGPLMINSAVKDTGGQTSFFDLVTLQKLEVEGPVNGRWEGYALYVRASADGTVSAGWRSDGSPSGLHVLRLNGNKTEYSYAHESVGYVLAGQDGIQIYTALGLYSVDLKPYPGTLGKTLSYLPTYSTAYFLGIAEKTGQGAASQSRGSMGWDVSVYSSVDKKVLLTMPTCQVPAGSER